MILWCALLLCATVQVFSAPQIGSGIVPNNLNGKDVLKPTTRDIEVKKVDPLVLVANLPSSPINVTESAKPCATCGQGPLLACPKDEGDCGSGEACCYDTCRARQVCRPKSEIVGFKEPNKEARFRKREANDKVSNGGDESMSARQNENVPLALDDDYGVLDASSAGVYSPAISRPGLFSSNQESLPVFENNPIPFGGGEIVPPLGANPNDQFPPVPFGQSNGFEEEIPFLFNQAPPSFIPVQQPVIIPQQSIPGNDEVDKGFLSSLFG